MAEQKLEITKNGEYNNINLKPRYKKGIKGIDPGNHVIVEKVFAEGYKYESPQGYGTSYSCKAKYEGVDVAFWLNEEEHEQYKVLGGVGDKVKITLTEVPYVSKRGKGLKNVLSFELVE